MAKLIYVEASPRKQRSTSIAVAKYFLDEYTKYCPQDKIIVKDLWKMDLPAFDGSVIDAKYAIMHGNKRTDDQVAAWKGVESLIDEFKEGDKYLFSLPMWNFGIPYRLKHYVDLLVQPGYLFEINEKGGYNGLLKNKKAVVIYSRGGAYVTTGAANLDLQKAYMDTILRFIGFEDIQSVIIEPTTMGEDLKQESLKAAKSKAGEIAAHF